MFNTSPSVNTFLETEAKTEGGLLEIVVERFGG